MRDDLKHHWWFFCFPGGFTQGLLQTGFWSLGGKIVGLVVLVKSLRSRCNEVLTGDSYQMCYQVIWYCLGMREILNVPLDSIKYVTFSIPVILIRRLLSTGPLQKHSVNSDIFSKTRNCQLSNDCLCKNQHFRWLDQHENRQKLWHTNFSPTI